MKKLLLALLLTASPAFAADYCIQGGATSKMLDVFVQNSSVSTGAGLAGLAFNTGSLACSYRRAGGARVAITLATSTLGTYTSGAFKEVDGTNMVGFYEIGIPNAAIVSGADYVDIWCGGAANMSPVAVRIQLDCPVQAATEGTTDLGQLVRKEQN